MNLLPRQFRIPGASAPTPPDHAGGGNKRPRGAGQAPQPRQNTAIYVTGVPLDATVEEMHELFSRKCGVVAEEIDSGKPRIRLYTDSRGVPKGDALVVFFKPQSVDMAIMLLDDTKLRPDDADCPEMRIQAADSSYKKTQYADGSETVVVAGAAAGATPAGGAPDPGQGKVVRSEKDKQKIRRKAEKLQNKLEDWSDDDLEPQEKTFSRWDKTVVLKHMFTLEELEEDPTAILDIKEDIRDECEKLGDVKNVVLFDLEADGIVSVKFAEVISADDCVKLMNGRAFGGRVVEASIATGKERFKKSKLKADSEDEDDG